MPNRKPPAVALLLPLFVALSGCKDEEAARQYAQHLLDALQSYRTQVEAKIAAEEAAYHRQAATYERIERQDLEGTLRLERTERASRLTDQLQRRQDRPASSEIHDWMLSYAAVDFDSRRKLLEQEMDGSAQFLAGVQNLDLETKKVAALAEAIQALTQKPGRFGQIKQLAQYGQAVQKEYKRLGCVDLQPVLKDLDAEIKQTTDTAVQKSLQEKRQALQRKFDADKCTELLKAK